ncbi:heavy-metal-associated domain-containing protein [Ruminobacter sp.]|uniref:heavy-metal-associated domain-containing protein n=1 Tax=Ruminobacter sp. TaxID=2774296 RepID=UPI002EB3F84A|nr:heavy metal-associated domain-containing protein [Oscillospiraceae bacterium]
MANASVYYTLNSVDGKHDVKRIKQTLDALPGVLSVSVNAGSNQVAVDFDTTGVQSTRIQNQLEKAGFEIRETKTDNHTL